MRVVHFSKTLLQLLRWVVATEEFGGEAGGQFRGNVLPRIFGLPIVENRVQGNVLHRTGLHIG